MRTGLFAQLRIRPEAIDGNQVKLDVTVEEAKAKDLGFSLGYGTFEGAFVGAMFTERNLLGTGRPLSFTAEVSMIAYRGEILYVDKWFLETKNQLRLKLSAETTDYDSYAVFEAGVLAEVSRNLTDHWRVAAFFLPRKVEIDNSTIEPEFLGLTDYFVSSVGISSTLDFRDSILNPRNGWVFNTTFDVASSSLGSEVEYIRATYRFSYYRSFGSVLVAVGARAGVISPPGDEPLPIDEGFFTGGSRSVRSFADRELGPKQRGGDPIGGQMLAVYNAEVVFPLIGGLEGAVFVDAGSIGREVSDGFGELRYGIGGGLRYALPIGPLRLDYGVNPDPKKYEASGAFHFSFGFAF
jgi:outer membrane protein assembly factor BamA